MEIERTKEIDGPVTIATMLVEQNPTPALRFIGTNEEITKLAAAMARARKNFTPVTKDRGGQIGNQKFKYAPLSHLTKACFDQLSDEEVFVMQPITDSPTEGKHRLTTIIIGHGARIESWVDFSPEANVAEYGKHTTYLRRYMFNATFVMDGELDADEVAANKKGDSGPKKLTEGQATTIGSMFGKLGIEHDDRAAESAKIIGPKDRKDYTYSDGSVLISTLGTRVKEKEKKKEGSK